MSSVEERSRKLVGQVRCGRKFEPAHPLVAKLLAHDEERRKEFAKQRHSLYAPKYDAGTARRRLLIIKALFLTAARIGCRPLMNTSKYVKEPGGKRDLWITIGKAHVCFTIEPIKSKKGGQSERLCLVFSRERDRSNTDKSWEDREESQLENQLTEILVQMLLSAEASYRNGLARHREWIIERKAEAEAEVKWRLHEAERKARELQQKSEGNGSDVCFLKRRRSTAPIRLEPMWNRHDCGSLKQRRDNRNSRNGRTGRNGKRIALTQ